MRMSARACAVVERAGLGCGASGSTCFYCEGSFPAGVLIAARIPSQSLSRDARPGSVVEVDVCRACASRSGENDIYLSAYLKHALVQVPELSAALAEAGIPDRNVITMQEQLLLCASYDEMPDVIAHPAYERILSVVVKNARVHAFTELGRVLPGWPDTLVVQSLPRAPVSWVNAFLTVDHTRTWPRAGSQLMVRMFTGENLQSGWITVAPGSYVYTVFEDGGVTVRSIIREYLMTEVSWGGAGNSDGNMVLL